MTSSSSWTRRRFLTRTGLGLAATAGTCLGFAGDNAASLPTPADDHQDRIPDGSASKGMITPETDKAIQRGLAFLNASRWGDGGFGTNQYRGNVAITSPAAMAFMCAGHLPGRGSYGKI